MKNSGKSSKTTAKKAGRPAGTGFITELDRYLFGQGTHYKIFEKLGAIPAPMAESPGMYFAVWAPHAKSVGVVGDFNGMGSGGVSHEAPGGFRASTKPSYQTLELASFINLPSPQR